MDFFSFDKYIAPKLIKNFYIIVVILSILAGLSAFIHFYSYLVRYNADGKIFFTFIFTVISVAFNIILWRIVCEAVLALFNIRENIEQIKQSK